jgi:hypothetical protein
MWRSWSLAEKAAGTKADNETRLVLWTIAISFTAEYGIVGIYAKTIGRLSEWLHLGGKTSEDHYTDMVAEEYGLFLNQVPWYEFPYLQKLSGLWSENFGWSSITPRGLERRTIFTVGYLVKFGYAQVIGWLSGSAFEEISPETHATMTNTTAQYVTSTLDIPAEIIPETGDILASFPRYRAFTPLAKKATIQGIHFVNIEGNDEIMLTIITDTNHICMQNNNNISFIFPILTQPSFSRYSLSVPVKELHITLNELRECEIAVEHIYDY